MVDMGETNYVIGIEIFRDRSRGVLGLSQEGYIDRVLERFNMQSCSSGIAPILKGDKLSKMQCPRNNMEREQMKKIPYASAVGSLMYAQTCTRPDISFSVAMLGRYQRLGVVNSIAKPLRIYCDNTAVVFFSKNGKFSSGSKHMDLKYLVVKERVQKQQVSIENIRTTFMVVDPLTKGLPPKAYLEHVMRMGLLSDVLLLINKNCPDKTNYRGYLALRTGWDSEKLELSWSALADEVVRQNPMSPLKSIWSVLFQTTSNLHRSPHATTSGAVSVLSLGLTPAWLP
ncbi:Retrovirus-related Pol polyprotein from transposon TNT 1-94 [Vitis vinifera]|uniref:Retrovirus-related Pol polyprotein from transposon TNT 1-94 n=1 Tax=Vitis vinifera TaxID=29760 RepID=A0A438CUF1_VITVI|nr:Retrovirus-related Pol polyprotein from transposon TNT 1-94 [Vitis vinifera]